jgi:hypothetical protein
MSKRPIQSLPLLSTAEIAALAGMTVRHFNRLVRGGYVAKARRGFYAIDKAVPALIAYYSQGREGSGEMAAEKLRLAGAQRREIEQRVAIRARDLIPADAARAAFEAAMALIGSQLDGLGGRIAADVAAQADPAICKKVIFDETRRIRAAAAAELEAFAHPQTRGDHPQAVAGNNGG